MSTLWSVRRWWLGCLVVGIGLVLAPSALAAAPTFTQVPGSPFTTGAVPQSMAFSPSGGLLATANSGGDNVSVFTVNQSSGALTEVSGSPFTTGSLPVTVVFSPGGGLLAVVNNLGNSVSVFSVNQGTGALSPVSGSPFTTGAGSGPVWAAFSPSGGLLAVANQAVGNVSVFSVNPSTGALTNVSGSPFTTGSQPAAVGFSPGGGLLATANNGDSNVSVFSVDQSSGALTQVPGSPFTGGSGPASVAFNPGGGLLAVANQFDDTVSVFSVAQSTGALTPVSGSPFSTTTGVQPRSAAFSPSGGLLATADESSDNMSVFSVDQSTGALTQVSGSPFATGGAEPISVMFSPAGGLLATANAVGENVSVFSVPPSAAALSVSTSGAGSDAAAAAGSVSSAPAGISCSRSGGVDSQGTCSASFPLGTVVSLTASPVAGSSFTGWGGACSGTGACSVTLASAQSVSATFAKAGAAVAVPAKPVNTVAPKLSGTARAGKTLSCSPGSWTNAPTSFAYVWSRDGTPIAGATKPTYKVAAGDEQLSLSCAVTASNAAGAGKPAVSNALMVAVPVVKGCPRATGSLGGQSLGLVKLGQTRGQARHKFTHSSDRGKQFEDFFCLTPIGVRVGYASDALLKTLPASQRKRLQGRVVWASTSNAFYAIRGIRPGATLAAASEKLHTGAPFHIGLNLWYLAGNGASTAVLKVRHGLVEEIGIANPALTKTRKAQRSFLNSFS